MGFTLWWIPLVVMFLWLFLDFAQQSEEKGQLVIKDVAIIYLIIKIMLMI